MSFPPASGEHATHTCLLACPGPQALAGQRVVLLESGWKHSLAVTDSGRFYSWGRNVNGQVPAGPGAARSTAWANPERCQRACCTPCTARGAHTLPAPHRPAPPQLGHGGTQDCNSPAEVPALSRGSIDIAALTQAAQPVVMYSVAPSDRYAVVPDSAPGDSDAAAEVPASGGAAVPEAKRQKV